MGKVFWLIKELIKMPKDEKTFHKVIRSVVRGSILLETVIMLGLIGALTPVLYTHISDRKDDVANINKANTMLQLQRETEHYLQDITNRNNITDKTNVTPGTINSSMAALNNRYKIAFHKDGSNINAIIVETEGSGSDVKAAKVASLIGVSAGIKSSMNSAYAYGVNGLWIETLSNYGDSDFVASIPAGSTVVTTEYTEQKAKFYTSDMIVDSDIDMNGYSITANNITASKICLGSDAEENCRETWQTDDDSNFVMLKECADYFNSTASPVPTGNVYCQRALVKTILANCNRVAATYAGVNLQAPSGYYYLGTANEGSYSWNKKACYFVSKSTRESMIPTSAELSSACSSNSMYCSITGNYSGLSS